jgi:hypothetical protein
MSRTFRKEVRRAAFVRSSGKCQGCGQPFLAHYLIS